MSSLAAAALLLTAQGEVKEMRFNPSLQKYIVARAAEYSGIDDKRKKQLDEIANFVRDGVKSEQPVRLTFICTHNSRRSQLAQLWAKTAAEYHGVRGIETFSGGTEVTAFNPRAVEALKRAGFTIKASESGPKENPRYLVRFNDTAKPMECFSKRYGDPPNPMREFCAVLTCSQADAGCPNVSGAAKRVALPYDDPKAFDATPEEAQRYDERCQQIAREMLYIFAKVGK
jgi:arsenate reductase (thioredoxin)